MKYYAFYKPYGYLSQFSDEGKWMGLSNILKVDKDVYPLGRLDADSEGLLLLTNHRSMNHTLLDPSQAHQRTYHIQVEGELEEQALDSLEIGVKIRIKKKDHIAIAKETKLIPDVNYPPRNPPIRKRKRIPTSWMEMTLAEGKNRQVRRMTAAVGYPTLRLIRYSIEGINIDDMKVGELRELTEEEFFSGLRLKR
ncbi:MAG: pseudouridine synthase [Flavobacteriales bacterium]|nr:pseudouridine synthase [Flavobacteriales bacterium]